MQDEVVWLREQRRFAFLVARGAFYSFVSYRFDGQDSFLVENDEYDLWEERSITFEKEEE